MNAEDIDVLRKLRAKCESMVRYYGNNHAEKRAQNAALEAAGLEPIHKNLVWEETGAAEERRYVEVLGAVIEMLAPADAEAA